MDTSLLSHSLSGIVAHLVYFGTAIVAVAVFVAIYVTVTPHREFRLIREGNTAAAISLGAVLVGLAIPLAVSLGYSTGELEMVIWGVAIIAVQLFVFRFTDFVLQGLPRRIQAGEVAAATFLAAIKIATALILAAAVAGVPLPAAA